MSLTNFTLECRGPNYTTTIKLDENFSYSQAGNKYTFIITDKQYQDIMKDCETNILNFEYHGKKVKIINTDDSSEFSTILEPPARTLSKYTAQAVFTNDTLNTSIYVDAKKHTFDYDATSNLVYISEDKYPVTFVYKVDNYLILATVKTVKTYTPLPISNPLNQEALIDYFNKHKDTVYIRVHNTGYDTYDTNSQDYMDNTIIPVFGTENPNWQTIVYNVDTLKGNIRVNISKNRDMSHIYIQLKKLFGIRYDKLTTNSYNKVNDNTYRFNISPEKLANHDIEKYVNITDQLQFPEYVDKYSLLRHYIKYKNGKIKLVYDQISTIYLEPQMDFTKTLDNVQIYRHPYNQSYYIIGEIKPKLSLCKYFEENLVVTNKCDNSLTLPRDDIYVDNVNNAVSYNYIEKQLSIVISSTNLAKINCRDVLNTDVFLDDKRLKVLRSSYKNINVCCDIEDEIIEINPKFCISTKKNLDSYLRRSALFKFNNQAYFIFNSSLLVNNKDQDVTTYFIFKNMKITITPRDIDTNVIELPNEVFDEDFDFAKVANPPAYLSLVN